MYLRLVLGIVAGLAVVVVGADTAFAQGKSGKSNANKVQKSGKAIPPGQIKRYTRGAKLPNGLDYENILDLSKWNLKPLGPGRKYIRVDNEILEIAEDTQTVVDAIGLVDDLLK